MYSALLLVIAMLAHSGQLAAQDAYDRVTLDDFEDLSGWIKGDPQTDMQQHEVGYAPDTAHVKQGKQSLAFMVRVDWTPKPGERYPKGWPMISRRFDPPQDWSAYDRVEFWLYTETTARLPSPAIKCGFGGPDGRVADRDWHGISVPTPNEWQRVSIPLTGDQDWTQVTGIWLYVAEAWYQDQDRVNFYVDDMQLATRRSPRIVELQVTSRTSARGRCVELNLSIEGRPEGLSCRGGVQGRAGQGTCFRLGGKREHVFLPLVAAAPGDHTFRLELLRSDGSVVDSASRFVQIMDPSRRPYLCLVSFYTPGLKDADPAKLAVFNDTPYDGVAIPVTSTYDTQPVPEYAQVLEWAHRTKAGLRPQIWPWVASNRIVGRTEGGSTHPSIGDPKRDPYFWRIKCLDLDNGAGALSDMLQTWRHAVRLAKELGAPGIVLDLEAYNNYKAYDVAYVAGQREESLGEIVRACEDIGVALGRIVREEYPECVVWSLFSHFVDSGSHAADYSGPVYTTAGHIGLGFVKYCKRHNLSARYLCGGETTVGYYNPTPEALRRKIARRDAEYAPFLQCYPGFSLAGTISPYHDYKLLTGWIKQAAGDDPQLKTIEDFEPMFRTLFDAYDWVWIYAASAAAADPYKPENAGRYGAVMKRAMGG